MMIMQFILSGLVCALLFVWFLHKVRNLFVAGTITINRETELQGENIVMNVQTYVFDSQQKLFERMQHAGEAIVMRRKFLFERFQEILSEEQAKNKVASIKKEG